MHIMVSTWCNLWTNNNDLIAQLLDFNICDIAKNSVTIDLFC